MSDGFEPRSAHRGRIRPFGSFLMALRFLTRMPVPFVKTVDPPPLRDAMWAFPLVGAVVGSITGVALVLAHLARLPDLFCALLALAIAAMITGAFHEDGLADVADGFGGGNTREQRLEIMKDSRIGTFGTLTLIIAVIGRAALLAALLVLSPAAIILLLAGAAAFSRALMVDLIWATRPARHAGLSATAGQPSRNLTLLALAIGGLAAGLTGSYVFSLEAGVLALVAAGVAQEMLRSLAIRKIGGHTGDVCGAGQVMSETAMLAVYAAAVAFR